MKNSIDILTLFEALNNHEIFTPPSVARQLLNQLPSSIWTNPNHTFLDPSTKSGVFLREILFKLVDGLDGYGIFKANDGVIYNLNNSQERINHILKNMIYGIAISELSGYLSRRTLYGVMHANTSKEDVAFNSFLESSSYAEWSDGDSWKFIARHDINNYYDHTIFNVDDYIGLESEGNIFYPIDEAKNKITECNDLSKEDKYFPFIEPNTKHPKIKQILGEKMRFDVIIGNPPYQIEDDGHGSSAKPIYQHFVQLAKELNPRYMSFIIPARWFAGGKGLDSFRAEMLADKRIKKLVDFPDATDCFPNVSIEGGVCYFLWDSEHTGECEVVTNGKGLTGTTVRRPLDQYDIFIRHNEAISILEKVKKIENIMLDTMVLSRNPFGMQTNFKDYKLNNFNKSKLLYLRGGTGYVDEQYITSNNDKLPFWKVLTPAARGGTGVYPNIVTGKPIIAEPDSICTETYLVVGTFSTKLEAESLDSYLRTKFVRFLISLRKNAQHLSKDRFSFVPVQKWDRTWTDDILYKKYSITASEQAYIDTLIKEMI